MSSPEFPRPDDGNSLTAEQLRLASRLTLVGPGPALLYREACSLMVEQPPRETATHLIGHLLREVESAVRAVLRPERLIGDKPHRREVLAILELMGIGEDEPVGRFWLSLTVQGGSRSLPAWAHRRGLDLPRPVDDEFRSIVAGMENLLGRLIDEFETRWTIVGQRLDDLLQKPQPSNADARTIAQDIPHDPVALAYFFDRAGAAWLQRLIDQGFFVAPPDPEIDVDAGTIMFPFWPERGAAC